MMAGWVLYTALTTLLLVAAGAAAERLARALGAPTRAVWSGVVLVALSLSAVSLVQRMMPAPGASAAQGTIGGATQHRSPAIEDGANVGTTFVLGRVPPERAQAIGVRARRLLDSAVLPFNQARWQRYDAAFAGVLATLAAAGLLLVGGSLIRLHRLAGTFTPSNVDGVSVLLSRAAGPAVLGVFRPRVVIPAWVLTLPPDERRTILLHEQEHAAARDPMLVLVGIVALALQPWNLPLWAAVGRLRFALEADCDARVLRRSHHSARRYGALLIEVCARELAGRMSIGLPVSAFVDSTSHLERRVRRMTDHQPRLRSVSTAAALVVALASVAGALMVRVTNAQAAARRVHTSAPVAGTVALVTLTPAALDPVQDSTEAEVARRWQGALPGIVNTQREVASPAVRVVAPGLASRWLIDAAAPDRSTPRDGFVAETLTVRPSNSLWAMRARIIPRNADPMHPVAVTDTLGRVLPTADTLVVDGPVRLILPDAKFEMTVESLSGDLMVMSKEMPATDGTGGRWIWNVLGRSFSVSRAAAGAHAELSGEAVVKGERVP